MQQWLCGRRSQRCIPHKISNASTSRSKSACTELPGKLRASTKQSVRALLISAQASALHAPCHQALGHRGARPRDVPSRPSSPCAHARCPHSLTHPLSQIRLRVVRAHACVGAPRFGQLHSRVALLHTSPHEHSQISHQRQRTRQLEHKARCRWLVACSRRRSEPRARMGILLQQDQWSAALRETLPALIPLGLVGAVLTTY